MESTTAAAVPALRRNEDIVFYTPGRRADAFPYKVFAAGRTSAAPDEVPIRRRFNQHVMILTLGGAGLVEVDSRSFTATAGTLTWLDTSGLHSHRCKPGEKDWRFLWMGIRGYGLDSLFGFARARINPIIALADTTATAALFEAVIERLRAGDSLVDAENSAAVSRLVAQLAGVRGSGGETPSESALDLLMRRVRLDLSHNWRIADFARLARLSPSQLHRRFRTAFGTSPIDWLRRERVNLAKRQLVETQDRIVRIAARCGYPDPYHFSRDFRRIAGQSPSEFRRTRGT